MDTSKKDIENLFKKLASFNKYANSLSKWIISQGIKGYSTASISAIRKGNKPNKEKELIAYLEEYLGIVGSMGDDNFLNERKETRIEKIYLNQTFYMYHNGYDEETNEERLSRVVLTIGETIEEVYLQNIPHILNTDYKGTFSLSRSNRHLLFDLKTAINKEKLLHLMFIRPFIDTIPEIMLGVYSNIDSKGALQIGTLVLEHINRKKREEITPLGISYNSELYQEVQKPIRDFLREKQLNRLKVTTGIFSMNDLKKFLKKQYFKSK